MGSKNKPLGKQFVNEQLSTRSIMLVGEYVNANTKTLFQCKDGHTWSSIPSNVLRGSGCPSCAGLAKLSKDIINDRLRDRDIELISEYTSVNDRSLFRCKCGHIWDALPCKILEGCICPKCRPPSISGYSTQRPGYFYVVEFNGFIKYGITNSPRSRMQTHRRNGMIRVVEQRYYEDGEIPKRLEEQISTKFGGKFVSKDDLKDGWTETLHPDLLETVISTLP